MSCLVAGQCNDVLLWRFRVIDVAVAEFRLYSAGLVVWLPHPCFFDGVPGRVTSHGLSFDEPFWVERLSRDQSYFRCPARGDASHVFLLFSAWWRRGERELGQATLDDRQHL